MESDFWHARWHLGETGWHLPHANPLLARHWPALAIPHGGRVFVPLCGKTEDMAWLAEQGYRVVGVELSEAAARDFFASHNWTPAINDSGALRRFAYGPIEIHCGDYFALDAVALGAIDAAYDRGALVALPPGMRERYVDHLTHLLPHRVNTLLITFDYEQRLMDGPPFSVDHTEVTRHFSPTHSIELLSRSDVLAENPRFRERGLSELQENVFALKPRFPT